jgi:hypothetical protein
MKKLLFPQFLCCILFLSLSCEKDKGLLPDIGFKTGGNYTSSDASLAGGSALLMGISASKTEDKDVLKQFNISKSVNGGDNTSVFDKSLSGAEGDTFQYDYSTTVDDVSGQTATYTFTVTNRDGLVNQVSLTITTL